MLSHHSNHILMAGEPGAAREVKRTADDRSGSDASLAAAHPDVGHDVRADCERDLQAATRFAHNFERPGMMMIGSRHERDTTLRSCGWTSDL
jgi:hypothetical protein